MYATVGAPSDSATTHPTLSEYHALIIQGHFKSGNYAMGLEGMIEMVVAAYSNAHIVQVPSAVGGFNSMYVFLRLFCFHSVNFLSQKGY